MAHCPECQGHGHYRVKFGQTVSQGQVCSYCGNSPIIWTFTHDTHKQWYMADCIAATKAELYLKLKLLHGCSHSKADKTGLVPIQTSLNRIPVKVEMEALCCV